MEVFDLGIVKREALDDFHTDTAYLDHMMPYSNDVFDPSVDWLSNLVDERSSTHSLDQLGQLEYPNLVLNSVNRDQTLNRLNGITLAQRTYNDDLQTSNAFSTYSTSPVSAEFDHRLDAGSHDLDCEMKSFYSGQQLYAAQGLSHTGNVDFNCETTKMDMQKSDVTLPVDCEDDDNCRSSADSDHERDGSESGYDSGAHSPTSETPSTPPRCLMLSQVDNDGSSSSTGDVTSPIEQPQNRQPFFLSEEEKRTLITEGLPIPAGYPLTKSEERALKKVRRKIKNKISAQESRRKKKEYMETLEKRVEMCSGENLDLRKKLESMETANRTLIGQLQKLQAIVASRVSRPTCANSTQTTDEASS